MHSMLWAEKGSYKTYQCTRCGFVYTFPVPSQEELQKIYGEEYFEDYDPAREVHDESYKKRLIQYKLDVKYILQFITSGKVLDFGCGSGKYLEAMPKSFEKFGFEFNPKAVEYAEKTNIGKFYSGDPHKIPIKDKSMDLVTMRGVIEHLPDPVGAAGLLASKLKSGGYLVVTATPNIDSPCAALYRDKWNLFYPPEHLNYFSARTLSLLGAKFGLYCLNVSYPYIETPYADVKRDSQYWLEDATSYFEGKGIIHDSSPPFMGNMLSGAFRKA